MKFVYAFFWLFGATLVSFLLATSIDMSHHELGALYNYFWPPVQGLISGLLYLIVHFIFNSKKIRISVLVFLCLYLLYVGFALHFEKDYWPFVIW